jgi:hypothetical protein
MINSSDLLHFEQLIRQLEIRSSELVAEESENWDDIPDEFLDPILNTIMTDPVLLPSRKICDRAVIIRHLLSTNTDPFNQLYLDESMLQPEEELRERIEEWIRQKKGGKEKGEKEGEKEEVAKGEIQHDSVPMEEIAKIESFSNVNFEAEGEYVMREAEDVSIVHSNENERGIPPLNENSIDDSMELD